MTEKKHPGLKYFSNLESTPVQTPATIDSTEIQQCLNLSSDIYEDHPDSSHCRKNKWLRIRVQFLTNFLFWLQVHETGILQESTPDPWLPLESGCRLSRGWQDRCVVDVFGVLPRFHENLLWNEYFAHKKKAGNMVKITTKWQSS